MGFETESTVASSPPIDFALFSLIGSETADICDGLTDEQWEMPSTCAGWKVKHLIAHQASGTTYSAPRMTGYLLRYRSQSTAGHHMALDMGDSLSREQIIAEFRRGHGVKPVNLFARISDAKHGVLDASIHLQDLRRTVDEHGEIPIARRELLFDLLPATGGLIGSKHKVAGLTLRADDLERSVGSGPLVQGPFEAIMMAAGGREDALRELSGSGLSILRDRIAH